MFSVFSRERIHVDAVESKVYPPRLSPVPLDGQDVQHLKIDSHTCSGYSGEGEQRFLPGNAMPTVLRIGAFRFHFYSDEGNEPPHIHIETPEGECKFWLEPIRLARNKGVTPLGLRSLERL